MMGVVPLIYSMHVMYIQREVEGKMEPVVTSRHAKFANGKIFIYIYNLFNHITIIPG